MAPGWRDVLVIALGAAAGANARYWLSNWFVARFGPAFPWGTLFINVSGGLVIGLVLTVLGQRLVADPTYRLLLVTGFLGAYTTFSTFTYETAVSTCCCTCSSRSARVLPRRSRTRPAG